MPNAVSSVNAAVTAVAVAAFAYVALVACAQVLRRAVEVRFGLMYHAFAAAAALAAGLAAVPASTSWRAEWLHHAVAAAVVLGVFPAATLLNHLVWSRRLADGTRSSPPPLLADATRLAILLVVGLAVLQFRYGVKVPGLLAGSGVAALILGLAMQDLLGNMLAGFALYVAKPFQPGDWLLVDGQHARVLEFTWRSTRFVTLDDVQLEVPNTDLVKRPVINFRRPTPRHAVRVTIGLHYDVPPARALEVLRSAAGGIPGVCAEPAPVALVKELADSSVAYEVKVWIDDHALYARVTSDLRSHCWYAARRAGFEIPYPQLTLHRAPPPPDDAEALAAAAAALHGHPIFGFLPADQVETLLRQSRVVLFAPADHLVEQDAVGGASMFLLVRGEVEVRVARGGHTSVVKRLGPGDCLGEMSLLTGERRSATGVACGEVEAVEITKEAFGALVRDHPEILGRLSEIVAERQRANRQLAAGDVAATDVSPAGALARLRSFFALGP